MRKRIKKSADKKPQNYVDQDGKTKVRMVPANQEVEETYNRSNYRSRPSTRGPSRGGNANNPNTMTLDNALKMVRKQMKSAHADMVKRNTPPIAKEEVNTKGMSPEAAQRKKDAYNHHLMTQKAKKDAIINTAKKKMKESTEVNEVSDDKLHDYIMAADRSSRLAKDKSKHALKLTAKAKTASSVRRAQKVANKEADKHTKRELGIQMAQRKQNGRARVNATESVTEAMKPISKKEYDALRNKHKAAKGRGKPHADTIHVFKKDGEVHHQHYSHDSHKLPSVAKNSAGTKHYVYEDKMEEAKDPWKGQPVGVHVHMKDKNGKVSKTTFLGTHQAVAGAKKHIADMQKKGHKLHKKELAFAESVEQIDEISLDAHGRYTKAARKDLMKTQNKRDKAQRKRAEYDDENRDSLRFTKKSQKGMDKQDAKMKKFDARIAKRKAGIKRAVSNVDGGYYNRKEDVDQIDEISQAMAGRYVRAADKDAVASDKKRDASFFKDQHTDRINKRKKGMKVAFNKLSGDAKVNARESVEQIDEISAAAKAKYSARAGEDHGDAVANMDYHASKRGKEHQDGYSKEANRAQKRMKGLKRANPGKSAKDIMKSNGTWKEESEMSTDEVNEFKVVGQQKMVPSKAAMKHLKSLYAKRATTAGHGKRAKINAKIDAHKKEHGIEEANYNGNIKLGGEVHPMRKVPIKHHDEYKRTFPGSRVKFRGPKKGKYNTSKSDATHFYVVQHKESVEQNDKRIVDILEMKYPDGSDGKGWHKAKRVVTDKSGAKHDPMSRAQHASRLGLKQFLKKNKASDERAKDKKRENR